MSGELLQFDKTDLGNCEYCGSRHTREHFTDTKGFYCQGERDAKISAESFKRAFAEKAERMKAAV